MPNPTTIGAQFASGAYDVVNNETTSWTNPANARGPTNQTVALASFVSNARTHYLRATDFRFTQPPGVQDADILGIQFNVTRFSTGANTVKDVTVFLLMPSSTIATEVGNNHADSAFWSTSSGAFQSYGNSADLWNASSYINWANLTASGFGISIVATGVTGGFARIDSVAAYIIYNSTGAFPTTGPTLFIAGPIAAERTGTLFLAASYIMSSSTLFTAGNLNASGFTTAFVIGGPAGSSTLYTWGHQPFSGVNTLYTFGANLKTASGTLFEWGSVPISGAMNLFMQGIPITTFDSGINPNNTVYFSIPNVSSGGRTSFFRNSTMYVKAGGYPVGMNLYIGAPSIGQTSTWMNLFIVAAQPTASRALTLFIGASGGTKSTTLFAQGVGSFSGYNPWQKDGAYPIGAGMNLFIQRQPAATLPLFINSQYITGVLPLYIYSGNVATGALPMFMIGGLTSGNANLQLYVNGF